MLVPVVLDVGPPLRCLGLGAAGAALELGRVLFDDSRARWTRALSSAWPSCFACSMFSSDCLARSASLSSCSDALTSQPPVILALSSNLASLTASCIRSSPTGAGGSSRIGWISARSWPDCELLARLRFEENRGTRVSVGRRWQAVMLAQVTGWRSPRTSDAQTPLASPECRFAPDAALCRRAPRPANQAPTLAIFASAASTRAAASAAKPTLLAMVRSGQLAGVTGIGVIRQRSESALTIWRCWSGPLLISITPVAGGSLFLRHDRDRQLVDLAGDSLGDRAGAPGARLVPSCVT